MSVLKYTRKYLTLSLLALLVICGVGALVYSQIHKDIEPDESITADEKSDTLDVRVNPAPPRLRLPSHIVTDQPPVKDADKVLYDWCMSVPFPTNTTFSEPYANIPSPLRGRTKKVNSDSNSYYTNPNYFEEVYEAISNGQDMTTTIKRLKEYRIYTDVVLEHMDSYEAFKYVVEYAPADRNAPAKEYGDRVISASPHSPEALEAGLYIAIYMTNSPHEKETYLRGALKYHPHSDKALYELGGLLSLDKPAEAIFHLKKGITYNPAAVNSELGVAYERLGDYKTAWVHYKKALQHNPADYSLINLKAIEKGEPVLSPIDRKSSAGSVHRGVVTSQDMPNWTPRDSYEVFVEGFPMRDDVLSERRQVETTPSPEVRERQDAEQQAFMEILREQEREAQEAYYKELDEFIHWADSILKDAPIDTNNFLSQEMERHLLGKKTTFDPDRITRGFDYIEKYGQGDGIKRLEKDDPELAKQVKQMLNRKPKPHSRSKQQDDK